MDSKTSDKVGELQGRRTWDGAAVNVPAAGLADNSPHHTISIHGSLGLAYPSRRGVLVMFASTAARGPDGIWRLAPLSSAAP